MANWWILHSGEITSGLLLPPGIPRLAFMSPRLHTNYLLFKLHLGFVCHERFTMTCMSPGFKISLPFTKALQILINNLSPRLNWDLPVTRASQCFRVHQSFIVTLVDKDTKLQSNLPVTMSPCHLSYVTCHLSSVSCQQVLTQPQLPCDFPVQDKKETSWLSSLILYLQTRCSQDSSTNSRAANNN